MPEPFTNIDIIRSFKGTIIKRYKNRVGKEIGSRIYVHKKYAVEVIPSNILKKAALILKENNPTFHFNSIMWNKDTNEIRFDEAPDFDTAREPHVGNYISISPNGNIRIGNSNNIWHHKWLWVRDDYTGFDVEKSKEWSKKWISTLKSIAKGTSDAWEKQLQDAGIVYEGIFKKDAPVILGIVYPNGEVKAIEGSSEDSRHPSSWSAGNRWRYVPEIEMLNWWETPSDFERNEVKDYLNNNGFKIRRSGVLTIRPWTPKSNEPIAEIYK